VEKIRVALGSNDGKTIILDHMGEADYFYIFDVLENGQWSLVEKRKNTSPVENDGHGSARKLRVASAIFEDCDVVLARRGSPNFVEMRDQSRFQPVVTRVDVISGSLQLLGRSFAEIHALVQRRRNGERPKEMPIIQLEETTGTHALA